MDEVCWVCGKYIENDEDYVFYINNIEKEGETIETKEGVIRNRSFLSVEGGKAHYFADMIVCSDCYSKIASAFKKLRSEDIRKLLRLIISFVYGKTI